MKANERSIGRWPAAVARALVIVVGLAGFAGCGGGGGAGARDAGTGGSAGAGGSAGSSGGAGSNGGAGTGGAAGGGGQSTTGAAGADGGAADTVTGVDGGCSAIVQQHPDEGAQHLMTCSDPVTYHTVPPSSGNHYGVWANFRTYTMPVSWKNLVHSLEHGAVVIVYNCPGGCPEEVAQAQAFIDALPADPLCTLPAVRRVILAPDPTLDVRWAASAWTWTLRAPCFQQEAFAKFVSDHYAKAGEDTCYEPPQMMCPL